MKKLNLNTFSQSQSTTNTFPRMKEMFKETYNKRKIRDSVRTHYKPKELK